MIVEIAAALLVQLPPRSPDTATYANEATARLVASARERHAYQDRLVRDYRAVVRTRIDAALSRSRFARLRPLVAHETAARLTWAQPNDLKIDVTGRRGRSIFANAEVNASFERPWFIPRSLGDSIRLVDDELPETAALHPLAPGSESFYRYAIVDSVTLRIPGRTVNAVAVRVEPKLMGASLVAGDLWLDGGTAEVVRLTFVFLGDYLWETPDGVTAEDSAATRRGNVRVNRVVKLEADLEYALYDARYWMPYRQLLQLTVELPWFSNLAIPVRFLTTFDEYEVNTGAAPRFDARPYGVGDEDEGSRPDTMVSGDGRRRRFERTRCPGEVEDCVRSETGYYRVGVAAEGGRWEVHYPPDDTLASHVWSDELALALNPEDERRVREAIAGLGALQEGLPGQWVGRVPFGFAVESFTDIYRFNRVQGSSLGAGVQFRPGPDFTTVHVIGRIGLGDRRPTGSVTWRREAPGGRLDLVAYRDVREAEPWTAGLGFGNSVNALVTAHDDADYHLGLGGGARFRSHHGGVLQDATLGVFFERQESMAAFAQSDLAAVFAAGTFEPNPAISQGDFIRGDVSRRSFIGDAELRHGVEGVLRVDDGRAAGRMWAALRVPFSFLARTGAVGVRAGYVAGEAFPQSLFRAGGPQTVRGFPYGFRRGRGLWSMQLDYAVSGREAWAPVLFADVGDVFAVPTAAFPTGAGDGRPLVGVGLGFSALRGVLRLDLSAGLRPDQQVRFDLRFNAPR